MAQSTVVTQDITWTPAWRLRDLIARRDISAVEVLDHFLARIEDLNPKLRTFRHLDIAGAKEQAQKADQAAARGDELGLLHGIPVSVKEHISVAGMPVMGMGGAPGRIAAYDDLGVARLREAGAVIVGTNTMMGTQSSAPGKYNWDAEARSPWDLARVPGWSSSGGAAAAAARLLPITIGSDGGGSTRLPGAYSGVVGVHPSAGLVPSFNYGAQARRDPTVTIGPLARDLRDAATTLQAMAGPDGRDFDAIQADAPDMLTTLESGVEGMRLAWTDDFGFTQIYAFPESATVIAAIGAAAQSFRTLGAALEPAGETWEDFHIGVMTTMQHARGGAPGAEKPSAEAWARAMDLRQRNWARFRALFRRFDLLISPTSQLLAPKMDDWGAYWAGEGPRPFPHKAFAPHYTSHTFMFNWLGFPAVSVPAGFVDGLPIGLQIIGWPGSEAKIFRAAHAFLAANPRPETPPVS